MHFRSFTLLIPLSFIVSYATALPESRRATTSVEVAEILALITSGVAVTCDICQEVLNKTQDFLKDYSTSTESYEIPIFTLREAVRVLFFPLTEVCEAKKLYRRSVRPVTGATLQQKRHQSPGALASTSLLRAC
jgi:hypothetical protein